MSETYMTSENPTASAGRSTWLVLGALVLFGLFWWFLPTPKATDPQPPLPVVENKVPSQFTPPEIATPSQLAVEATRPVAARTFNTSHVEQPSKGSLLPNPKPRDLVPDRTLYAKLDTVERHMTARSNEEAEWMDLQGFPTLEEVNSIDPESLEKYYHKPNINLRALGIQAAIWKRQGNPRWRDPASLLSAFGSIFGNRLLIDDLTTEKFSLSRDKSLVHRVLLGKMLGDNYTPYDPLAADQNLRWSTLKVMSNSEITFDAFQINIPRSRVRAGLPPLQVVRIPVAGRQ
jgi:hypothetical protein